MSLFPELSVESSLTQQRLEQISAEGALSGPSYSYRGAVIDCQKGGHVCRLRMAGHLLDGFSFGMVGSVTSLVDLWLDEKRLPYYMQVVPSGRGARRGTS